MSVDLKKYSDEEFDQMKKSANDDRVKYQITEFEKK